MEPRQARYSKRIPWRVSSKHRNEAAVRMLRLLGRRDLDPKALPQSEAERLDGWLTWLRENDAVVAYCPDRPQGFYYVPTEEGDEWPIRPRELDPDEFYD